jgi:hypothetical protein
VFAITGMCEQELKEMDKDYSYAVSVLNRGNVESLKSNWLLY